MSMRSWVDVCFDDDLVEDYAFDDAFCESISKISQNITSIWSPEPKQIKPLLASSSSCFPVNLAACKADVADIARNCKRCFENEQDVVPATGPKRPKRVIPDLHKACCDPNVSLSEMDTILRQDPQAASRIASVSTTKKIYNPYTNAFDQKSTTEEFSFPLNLAIRHKLCSDVICALVAAAPSVMGLRDGSQRENPLSVLLKNYPHDIETIRKMVSANRACLEGCDRHQNTPLHIGVQSGAPLEVIRYLFQQHPDSLRRRNRNGWTPLDLSQRQTSLVSDAVSTFLLRQQSGDSFDFA
jgi:hypothetical protein